MNAQDMQHRMMQFIVRIVNLFRALPKTEEARIIGKQMLRSGTSTAANYRAACRARSKPEFISKIGLVVEEADETVFWLEVLTEVNIVHPTKMKSLIHEANELLAIVAASQKTAKRRQNIPPKSEKIPNPQ